ncbi:MAG TPA: creatininase family protein [Myxococcales bacterium]|nr:creatininase family protein [Myxococcales bacterium]
MPHDLRHDLLELPWVDVKRWLEFTDVVLVPIGSCEKHGPHIPLGTDSYVTIEAVKRAARLADVPHSPLLPIGFSPHHMGEPGWGTGTISLPADTFRDVLWGIGKSLIYAGFNKLIFVSHHGSNSRPMEEALRRLRFECGAFTAWYKTPTERETTVLKDVLEGPPEETPGWHSGELETAAMMAYAEDYHLPGAVRMERAKPDRAHAPRWMGPAFSKRDGMGTVIFRNSENIFVPMNHHEYCDTATIGNPLRNTSVEKGRRIFEKMAAHLADFVGEVKKMEVRVPDEKRDWPNRGWF